MLHAFLTSSSNDIILSSAKAARLYAFEIRELWIMDCVDLHVAAKPG